MTPEMLSLFMFHEVRNLSQHEEVHIIKELVRHRPQIQCVHSLNVNAFIKLVPNRRTVSGENHKFGSSNAWIK